MRAAHRARAPSSAAGEGSSGRCRQRKGPSAQMMPATAHPMAWNGRRREHGSMRRLRREPVRGPGRIEFGRRGEHTLARPSPGRRGRGLGGERRRLTGEAASVAYPSRWAEVHCLSPSGWRSRSESCYRGRASGRYPGPRRRRRRRRLGRGHGRQRPPPCPCLVLSALCLPSASSSRDPYQSELPFPRCGRASSRGPRSWFFLCLLDLYLSRRHRGPESEPASRRQRARRDSEPSVTASPP